MIPIPYMVAALLFFSLKSMAQPYTSIELKKDKPYENRTLPAEKTGNKKFTLPKRIYNNTVTHFNYYFNANQRLNEILERASESHRDDYTQLLSFYDYDLETTAQDQIDTVLYKCTAGILLHDLRSDWVDNLYMLMGKAYLLRKDFDSAQMVFQYINYAFAPKDEGYDIPIGSNASNAGGIFSISTNEKRPLWKKLTTTLPSRNESFIWMTRTFIEQDKAAEAAGLLALLRSDALFPVRLQPELDELSAYLFYKLNAYDSAANYLVRALKKGNDHMAKARSYYLAGQLYELAGNNKASIQSYQTAIRFSTDPFMEVYARLNIAALSTGDKDNALQENLNELLKMAKKDKYDVYRDIIYYAAAKLELSRKNYNAAQQWLLRSVSFSNDNPLQKQQSFLLLGDLNYDRKAYSQSFRFYDSVQVNMVKEKEQERINTRKPALQLIAMNEENINREDSVQQIATLPEAERTALLKKILRQLRKERGLKETEETSFGSDLPAGNTQAADLFNNNGAEFYFLNSSLRSRGLGEFNRRWGNRPNIDNWRRQSAVDKVIPAQNQAIVSADNKPVPKKEELSLEALQNTIPLTEEQKELSNTMIIRGLLENGKIFQEQLDDYPSAIEVYEELLRRFPRAAEAEEAGFNLIQCYRKTNNLSAADSLQNAFAKTFADSKFLNNTNAANKKDPAEIIYSNIYNLFIEGKFESAIQAKKQTEQQYKNSQWTPQLLYIESIYYIKQKADTIAINRLQQLLTSFPSSPLAEKAATMIDVLSRRAEIEKYLTDLSVERPAEAVTRGIDLTGPASIINTIPKKDSSVTATPLPKEIKQAPGINLTNVVKSAPLTLAEPEYEFVPTDTQYAVIVLNKVDGMFVGEARNAFNRFNQEKFYNRRLPINTITIVPEIQLLLVGPFPSASDAVSYTDLVKPQAASRILPWLSADKYGFQIISPANLRILQNKKDIAAYRAFMQKILPDKF
ncbi:tetratricopeptide repeat protein [Sediminibacterium sp.]|uniref:type IX secretion system periplasmic lipoprotein PorW/SprE n=1 Tax=Sediminibacterium sp. TaxID=1917865 RepID=UPI0025E2FCBC|nr:tetratricopeptide repeat protein [Sediminibacterium sp.]MBW0178004.1 tetratricopeptide repeat protein [Sediminibacterium sp.]